MRNPAVPRTVQPKSAAPKMPVVPAPCGGRVGPAVQPKSAALKMPAVPAPCGGRVGPAVQPKSAAPKMPAVPAPCGGRVGPHTVQPKRAAPKMPAVPASAGARVGPYAVQPKMPGAPAVRRTAPTIQRAGETKSSASGTGSYDFKSERGTGAVTVTITAKAIFVKGALRQGSQNEALSGQLDYTIDQKGGALVIDSFKATPKRRGLGALLAFYAAAYAIDQGLSKLRADLVSLEEGSVEFYQAAGFQAINPTLVEAAKEAKMDERAASVVGGVQQDANTVMGRAVLMLHGKWKVAQGVTYFSGKSSTVQVESLM